MEEVKRRVFVDGRMLSEEGVIPTRIFFIVVIQKYKYTRVEPI